MLFLSHESTVPVEGAPAFVGAIFCGNAINGLRNFDASEGNDAKGRLRGVVKRRKGKRFGPEHSDAALAKNRVGTSKFFCPVRIVFQPAVPVTRSTSRLANLHRGYCDLFGIDEDVFG